MSRRIALLGTGLMGHPMAITMLQAGLAVSVWNRSKDKAESLRTHGARVADTPAEAVRDASIVISMLDTNASTEAVLFESGLPDHIPAGATIVVMSSLKPEEARDHAKRLAARHLAYLDAPVSGGPGGAAAGTLAIMVGGDRSHFDRVHPVLATMGKATLVGPAGCGMLAKLANQIIVGVTITAVAEALLLARAGGADMDAVREAMTGGFADSKILQLHGRRMIERKFRPGGAATIHLKDMNNILGEAKAQGVQLPTSELIRDLYAGLVERGLGDVDHSGTFLEIEHRNDIHLPFSKTEGI